MRLLFALGWLCAANAAPEIRIEATVSENLRRIEGRMWLPEDWVHGLRDPLARLPDPPDDLNLLRTWPGAPSDGEVSWTPDEEATSPEGITALRFTARLPRRFGATGKARGGLYLNGGWYPQPTTQGALPTVDWEVKLALPTDTLGAVGSAWGDGAIAWRGTGERASLAVVRGGQITALSEEVALLTRGSPRRVLVAELQAGLKASAIPGVSRRGVVVQAPLHRRLARPGVGMSYVSDRAFRLTPGLARFHRVSVIRGVSEGLLPLPDPFERSVAAAAISDHHAETLRGAGASSTLGKLSWIPTVHWLLASQRMPFFADVLERTHPHDPVADDLTERFAPYTPGTVVHSQLDDTFGEGTGRAVGLSLAQGLSLPEAIQAAARQGFEGPTEPWILQWTRPYPAQDYRLMVDRQARALSVYRDAPPDAQSETLIVAVDGTRHPMQIAPGEAETLVLDEPPRRVRLDPDRHLAQTSRMRDSWPARFSPTLSGWIDTVNLTRLQLYGTGQLTLRRQYDTRNLWYGTLTTTPGTLVGARVAWLRRQGPLQDGLNRPHRFTISGGASLLNPEFSRVDRIRPSLTGSLNYAWDTRVGTDFPLRGRALAATVGGGFIPGLGERWGYAEVAARGVLSPHPRHAFAGRASAALAWSDVQWRQLGLGGAGALLSLPVLPACLDGGPPTSQERCSEQASRRAVAGLEYRVAPIRNASVPAILAWGSELQLTGGVEGVVAEVRGAPAAAVGVTAGIAGIADVLGAEPMMMGLTAGWPVWWTGLEQVERSPIPEIYVRWSQIF